MKNGNAGMAKKVFVAIAVVCFLAIGGMQDYAHCLFLERYWDCVGGLPHEDYISIWDYIQSGLGYFVLYGIILAIIPLEEGILGVRKFINRIATRFGREEDVDGMRVAAAELAYIVMGFVVYRLGTKATHKYPSESVAAIFCALTIFLLVQGVSLINNLWENLRFALVLLFVNCLAVTQMTREFFFGLGAFFAGFLLWNLCLFMAGRHKWWLFGISLILGGLLFFFLVDVTGHGKTLAFYGDGGGILSGRALLEEADITSEDFLSSIVKYPFSMMKYTCGSVGVVIFALLIIVFSFSAMFVSVNNYKKTPRRAGGVMGIYLYFAVPFLYVCLTELGVAPGTSLNLFYNGEINIFLFLLALRMLLI